MSEENENSEKDDKEENSEKEEKEDEKEEKDEKEDEKENFTTYEEEIITILNKLSETIDTFNTLSREQAENAILETDIKIDNCKKILEKMEEYINKLKNEDDEKIELNKKLLNYKTEFSEIMNKYKEIQENYINKKTENALMEENLIDEDNNRNSIRITTGTAFTNNDNPKGAGNPHMIDGELDEEKKKKNDLNNKKENENKKNINNTKNNEINKGINNKARNEISLIAVSNNNNNNLGYYLSPNKEKEEGFHEINRDYDKRKKIIIIICVAICIVIFFLIFLIALFS